MEDILVHAITDGRDTSPTGGAEFLQYVEPASCRPGRGSRRSSAAIPPMDRDRRWERTKLAWDAIVLGRGEVSMDMPGAALRKQYAKGKTDEFMPPLIFSHPDEQRIRDGDVVLFFNFRTDRTRTAFAGFPP